MIKNKRPFTAEEVTRINADCTAHPEKYQTRALAADAIKALLGLETKAPSTTLRHMLDASSADLAWSESIKAAFKAKGNGSKRGRKRGSLVEIWAEKQAMYQRKIEAQLKPEEKMLKMREERLETQLKEVRHKLEILNKYKTTG